MHINSVAQFLQACNSAQNNDDVYDIFEFAAADNVRDEIMSHAAADSSEPVREALNLLGRKHNIAVLRDY